RRLRFDDSVVCPGGGARAPPPGLGGGGGKLGPRARGGGGAAPQRGGGGGPPRTQRSAPPPQTNPPRTNTHPPTDARGNHSAPVNKDTKVLIQGITGGAGSFHTVQCIAYGTQIVAGCTPGRGGQNFEAEGPGAKKVSVPVFDTVAEAVQKTGAEVSCIFVPAL